MMPSRGALNFITLFFMVVVCAQTVSIFSGANVHRYRQDSAWMRGDGAVITFYDGSKGVSPTAPFGEPCPKHTTAGCRKGKWQRVTQFMSCDLVKSGNKDAGNVCTSLRTINWVVAITAIVVTLGFGGCAFMMPDHSKAISLVTMAFFLGITGMVCAQIGLLNEFAKDSMSGGKKPDAATAGIVMDAVTLTLCLAIVARLAFGAHSGLTAENGKIFEMLL